DLLPGPSSRPSPRPPRCSSPKAAPPCRCGSAGPPRGYRTRPSTSPRPGGHPTACASLRLLFQCDDALRHLLKRQEQDVMGRAGVPLGVDVGPQGSRRDVTHAVTVEVAHFSYSNSALAALRAS